MVNLIIEICSVCRRSFGNRIVMRRNSTDVICSLHCAMQSIGAANWHLWFEQEARTRMQRYQKSKVIHVDDHKMERAKTKKER